MMQTNEEPFLGKVIVDMASVLVRDVLHELRPDILFSDEFKEAGLEFSELEPRAVATSFINNVIRGKNQ